MSVNRTVPHLGRNGFNDGQVSGSGAELQSFINDFTWTARLDFFEVLVSDEPVEDSSEGW